MSGVRTGGALRAVLAGGVAAAVAVGGIVLPAAPASAFVGAALEGRGFGHGHGMSQYGAKGRAEAGQAYATILAAYYPGTTLATGSDTTGLRVWIQGDTDQQTWVVREAGMTIRTAGAPIALPATVNGAVPTMWRLWKSSETIVLDALVGGTWTPHGVAAITAALAGQNTATLTTTDGTVDLVDRSVDTEYRGTVSAQRVGTTGSSVLRTVVTSAMRDYLRSVVPSEMPASWSAEAVKAQSVAARTYASWDRASGGAAWYDTCDTTQCQVYNGWRDKTADGATVTRTYENALSDAAVAATAGKILTYGGTPAFTQFSASNGGYSAAGSQPYLTAAPDPFDAYPAWDVTLDARTMTDKYPQIGGFTSLTVLARDGKGAYGGRVTSVRIGGTASSVTLTGNQFRSAFGLKSTLFSVTNVRTPIAAPQRDWTGDGGPDLIGRAPDGALYVYRGLPGATWAKRYQIGKGWNTMRLMTQVHNFGGTAKPEIITTNAAGKLYLYPGNGTGGFGTPVALGQGWWGFDRLVGVQGFHAKGAAGILARKAATGHLLFYPGNGNRGFGVVKDLGGGWNAYDQILFAGDWDGDGPVDVIAREKGSTGRLMLFRGTRSATLNPPQEIGRGWNVMDEIVGAADWNRDGNYDLIAREDGPGTLWLYPGDGTGGFLKRVQVGNGWLGFTLVK